MASRKGWPFFLLATNCELKAEDCGPTAIANRRLTADWDTNYELRTTIRPMRIDVCPSLRKRPSIRSWFPNPQLVCGP